MRKLLFVINNFEVGGIQKSLVELLKLIEKKYDISVYCPDSIGAYKAEIPHSVNIISGDNFAKVAELGLTRLKAIGWHYFLLRLIFVQWSRLFGRKIPAYIYAKFISRTIKDEYDIVFSYSQPLHSHQFAILTNEIALFSVNAHKKVSFLHCDYKAYGGNTPYSQWLYKRFDSVVTVSHSVKKCFVDVLSDMAEKTYVVYNSCDVLAIRALAEKNSVRYSKLCFVSISRLSKEKGLLRCVPIFKRLKDEGFLFEWHIIGDGPEWLSIETGIKENGLQNNVIMEGNHSNPYRFMKNANFLFLPSFHEAAPMVFNEAACLGVCILTTNTLSAKELVEDRKLGVVCNNDSESIYNMLHNALKGEYKHLSPSISESYNTQVVDQFDDLVQDLHI